MTYSDITAQPENKYSAKESNKSFFISIIRPRSGDSERGLVKKIYSLSVLLR